MQIFNTKEIRNVETEQHHPEFKANVALEALKGEETASELATRFAGALLDRLTHHVHILEMNGENYRLKHNRKNRQ